jgi:hypothetical protein
MTETIFNLYYIVERDIIRGRAAIAYERSGTDDEKILFLQAVCRRDFPQAKRYPVPAGWVCLDVKTGKTTPGLTWDSYQQKIEPQFGDSQWFEDIFLEFDAPQSPLMVVTCVVDGAVKVEGQRDVT